MGNFTFEKTAIEGLVIVHTKVFGDERGYFMETYHEGSFDEAGYSYRFVQGNQSSSRRGVLRGLHFQVNHPQAKYVRVISGEVFDVAVDLRRSSQTYGKWVGVTLSAENKRGFLIPRGFAHGFVVTSDSAEFSYLCDDLYHPEDEGGIIWNDPGIGIDWPDVGPLTLSEKDQNRPTLRESRIAFDL